MMEQRALQPTAAAAAPRVATTERATDALRGETVFNAVFGRLSLPVSIIVLVISVVMPARGVGFTVCWFLHLTQGLPCPGCGLTRSIASLTHLQLGQAFSYHPFGVFLWSTALFVVVVRLGGERRRDAVRRWFVAHGSGVHRAYMGIVFSFLAFGVGRLIWQFAFTKLPPIY